MSEDEALELYCASFHYDAYFTADELKELHEVERKSIGFQSFLLHLAAKDLGHEMFECLPGWLKLFLKNKGE